MNEVLAAARQNIDVQGLQNAFENPGLQAWDWARAAIILVVGIALAFLAKRLVRAAVARAAHQGFVADLLGRLTGYVVGIAAFIYALNTLDVRVGPLLGALGIAGIALAFALKDILENFVAGILLQIRRPFRKSDQIVTGDVEGTVREITARTVVIDAPDGRQVVVPSSALITQPIVNLTAHPHRRTDLEVGVAYATDIEEARRAILDALAGVDRVLDVPAPEALVSEFGDSAIVFTVWLWHRPTIAEHWRVQDAAATAIKATFDERGIEIPFPQRVLWTGRRPEPTDDDGASAREGARPAG